MPLFCGAVKSPRSKIPFTPAKFVENKGQLCDADGHPAPYLLYKTGVPGLDIYITEKGLSYIFFKKTRDGKEEERDHKKDGKKKGMGEPFDEPPGDYDWERIDMELQDAGIKKENISQRSATNYHHNYFLSHCAAGIYDVKAFDTIIISNVYPKIDWLIYGDSQKGYKYDFIVHPGGNPALIKLKYLSLSKATLNKGSIQVNTSCGKLGEERPYSYLLEEQQPVTSRFELISTQKVQDHYESTFGFKIQADRSFENETLVIDPVLTWATLIGGADFDGILSVETDKYDNLFAGGYAYSMNYPVLNNGGYFQGTRPGDWDIILLKFTNNGVLLWSTYYGGSSGDVCGSVAIDTTGNLFVGAITQSTNCPVQNAGTYFKGTKQGQEDVLLIKFNNQGVRLWATYFGGTVGQRGNFITCDTKGNIFATGYTESSDFPLVNTAAYYQAPFGGGVTDMFVIKFDNLGNLLWSTNLGGNGIDYGAVVQCDKNDNVILCGYSESANFPLMANGGFQQTTKAATRDAIIVRFSNSGSLLWSTYYGGDNIDEAQGLAVDNNNNLFVLGITGSTDFPLQAGPGYNQTTPPGGGDLFLIKFNNLDQRQWATYFGSPGPDELTWSDNIEVNACGDIFFGYTTGSSSIPVSISCPGGYNDNSFNGVPSDIVIVSLSNSGVPLWGSYFGGNKADMRSELAFDSKGNLFVGGEWCYVDNPAMYPFVDPGGGAFKQTTGNGSEEGFVAKLSNPYVAAAISYSSPVCVNSGTLAPIVSGTLVPGGAFSSQGLVIDPSTGVITMGQSPGIYTITYSGGNSCSCYATIGTSATLEVMPAPLLSSQNEQVCRGGSDTLYVISTPSTNVTYSWSTGAATGSSIVASPSVTTNYTVTVTGANGCPAKRVITLTVTPVPTITVSDYTLCQGIGGVLTATVWPVDNYTISWMPGGLTGKTVTVTPTISDVYSVTAFVGECVSQETLQITVVDFIEPVTSFSYDSPFCSNETDPVPTLQVGFAGPGTFSGGPGLVINSNTGVIDLDASVPGIHMVTYDVASFECRLPGTGQTSVVIEGLPVITVSGVTKIAPGTSAVLEARGANSYTWSPAFFVSCVNCSNTAISPPASAKYCVAGTGTFCTSDFCVDLVVACDDGDFSLPNAFTPNGDGQNDEFCLKGWALCIKSFRVEVFDRWGEKVFESQDPVFCWDGNYKGKAMNTDVFVFVIDATYTTGIKTRKSGNITLIR